MHADCESKKGAMKLRSRWVFKMAYVKCLAKFSIYFELMDNCTFTGCVTLNDSPKSCGKVINLDFVAAVYIYISFSPSCTEYDTL